MKKTSITTDHAATDHAALQLIDEVFDAAYDVTETFRLGNIGSDLAYLMGAIADEAHGEAGHVDWSKDAYGERPPALLKILRKRFEPSHAVWKYIILDSEEDRHEQTGKQAGR